jgi:hypothetical protein
MARAPRATPVRLCTRPSGDDCPSRRVWGSHTWLAPRRDSQGEHATACGLREALESGTKMRTGRAEE